MITVTPEEIETCALSALVAHGATRENAIPVARAIARAEAEGNSVCGLFYLPIFCAHLECGKVDGIAMATVTVENSVISVDARSGFAHPAIAAGLPALIETARSQGIAAMAVRNSYNCLALGHHVTALAEAGLIGICMSNAPASVAPPGATRKIFGTNPIAFSVPVDGGPPVVVDQSMSAVTKTEMIFRKDRGEPIPSGWAQDAEGHPTTDAATGLEGSLLPAGGQKGANMALLIELLAAVLTGSKLSTKAGSFGDTTGGPPNVGQFFIAIDPSHFSASAFTNSLATLVDVYATADIRMSGRSNNRQNSLTIDQSLWHRVLKLARV
jgi:(2R)-3-sulfolactate dehydrogenase (NADP+)